VITVEPLSAIEDSIDRELARGREDDRSGGDAVDGGSSPERETGTGTETETETT
jgi:hypothetical protein